MELSEIHETLELPAEQVGETIRNQALNQSKLETIGFGNGLREESARRRRFELIEEATFQNATYDDTERKVKATFETAEYTIQMDWPLGANSAVNVSISPL